MDIPLICTPHPNWSISLYEKVIYTKPTAEIRDLFPHADLAGFVTKNAFQWKRILSNGVYLGMMDFDFFGIGVLLYAEDGKLKMVNYERLYEYIHEDSFINTLETFRYCWHQKKLTVDDVVSMLML